MCLNAFSGFFNLNQYISISEESLTMFYGQKIQTTVLVSGSQILWSNRRVVTLS